MTMAARFGTIADIPPKGGKHHNLNYSIRRLINNSTNEWHEIVEVLKELLQECEQKDFSEAQIWLERVAAVDPFQEHVQLIRSRLAAERKDWPAAVTAGEALLTLKPADPVEAHYRLAVALHALDDPRAKGEVLAALELAPRYRAAQELLLKLVDAPAPAATSERAPE